MFTRRIQRQLKKISGRIRSKAHRDICVYGPYTTYDCPNCFYDHSSGSSTGRHDSSFVTPTVINGRTISPAVFTRGRCPVCKGSGEIEFDNKKFMRSYVMWDPKSDSKGEFSAVPIGTEGSNVVLIQTDPNHYEFVRDCLYAEIDGVRCELVRPPTIRKIGVEDSFTLAFFASSEAGSSTRTR